mgnify:FL=1
MDKKIIVVINEYKYSLKNVLIDYSVIEIPFDINIINNIDNIDEEVIIIYLDINNIEKLEYLKNKIKIDVIFIPKINGCYTSTIEKKEFKFIRKILKKLKNTTLIINDNDKYLKNIFYNKLDIYRYGSNLYDDIEYMNKNGELLIKYQDKIYNIKVNDPNIIGNIIIGLLFGKNIELIIDKINNWENYLNSVYYLGRDVNLWK